MNKPLSPLISSVLAQLQDIQNWTHKCYALIQDGAAPIPVPASLLVPYYVATENIFWDVQLEGTHLQYIAGRLLSLHPQEFYQIKHGTHTDVVEALSSEILRAKTNGAETEYERIRDVTACLHLVLEHQLVTPTADQEQRLIESVVPLREFTLKPANLPYLP